MHFCFFPPRKSKEYNIETESTIRQILYSSGPIRLQIFCTLAIITSKVFLSFNPTQRFLNLNASYKNFGKFWEDSPLHKKTSKLTLMFSANTKWNDFRQAIIL